MNADFSINDDAYHAYSPVFLSTTSVLSYGLGFGAITSILVYTFLHHRAVIWDAMKVTVGYKPDEKEVDIHAKVNN